CSRLWGLSLALIQPSGWCPSTAMMSGCMRYWPPSPPTSAGSPAPAESRRRSGTRMDSFWLATAPETAFPALGGDLTTDVVVVGGGIAGMSTAALLKQSGRRVVVVEARRVGRQATGHSTAKVTSQHAVIYSDLERSHGTEAAALYAEANQ